ncbi:uncharacterized protein TRAVEDRAFT_48313 [Trametes versicolor FP-101664 SS1]|uniref:uncharacterized protein n=1 Tax=Trametes versicolor (strain FP-101664) TaxID=717944 RepID=UPI0004621486|nr:uncharacterized protein TRAVEDRAFT_48313 [Trametes versicolor FP-101664 SS1]EIW57271.1 hypothetical protein TRAVEDRAFT_48313 [Trametes versicolor FP-101664 SS1]
MRVALNQGKPAGYLEPDTADKATRILSGPGKRTTLLELPLHEENFTDRKLRIDAQSIAAMQVSPRPIVLYREQAARVEELRGKAHAIVVADPAVPHSRNRTARRASYSGPLGDERSGTSLRRSPLGDHTWSRTCIDIGSVYAVRGIRHQESGYAVHQALAVAAFSRIARVTTAYGAQEAPASSALRLRPGVGGWHRARGARGCGSSPRPLCGSRRPSRQHSSTCESIRNFQHLNDVLRRSSPPSARV